VRVGVLGVASARASWSTRSIATDARTHSITRAPPADFSTGCRDRQNMAIGAAAAVVVVLLVLYFSLGGAAAEPERIVLTRG
jgi:hypothetical protein